MKPDLHHNNFDLLRLTASLLVVAGHACTLYGQAWADPLAAAGSHVSLAGVAVYIFFIISGYLITGSLLRSPNILDYFARRALRIFPGLIAVLVISAVVIGPFITTLPWQEYLTQPEVYHYVLRGSMLKIQANDTLPGIFTHQLFDHFNGSLWTIPSEFKMYVRLGFLFLIFRTLKLRLALCVMIVFISYAFGFLPWETLGPQLWGDRIMHKAASYTLNGKFMFYFFSGAVLALLPVRYLQITAVFWIAIGAMVTALIFPTPLNPGIIALGLPYAVIYLALLNSTRAPLSFDISYGIYLWGFFLQQILLQFFSFSNLCSYIAASMFAAILAGGLSWVFIEQPALRLKEKLPNQWPDWCNRLRIKS